LTHLVGLLRDFGAMQQGNGQMDHRLAKPD
jgi:hypothetical protein